MTINIVRSKISVDSIYINIVPKLLFIYAIIFDNLNGLFQIKFQVKSSIGFFYRGAIMFLLLFVVFKIKKNIFIRCFFLFTSIYILCIPLWAVLGNDFILLLEIDYLFKLAYFFVILLYFYKFRNQLDGYKIIKCVISAGFFIALLNIFCLLSNTGNNSYGEDFGFGKKAFFVDGNSLAIYMVMVLSLSIWNAFFCKSIKTFIVAFVVTLGTLIIGSRVAVVGAIIVWVCFLLYFLFAKDKYLVISPRNKVIVFLFFGLIIAVAIYYLILSFDYFDSYTISKYTFDSALSSRDLLIIEAKKIISSFNWNEMIIGKGFSGGIKSLGENYVSKSGLKLTEADMYDSILCFGWGFGTMIILFNVVLLFKLFIVPYFVYRNSLTYIFALVGSLWFIVSSMAGHGYFNTMLAPLFGTIYLLTYKFSKL